MALVTRGRLSVQRVEEEAWHVINQMAEKGGWEDTGVNKPKTKTKPKSETKSGRPKKARSRKEAAKREEDVDEDVEEPVEEEAEPEKPSGRKRKAREVEPAEEDPKPRRSTRARR